MRTIGLVLFLATGCNGIATFSDDLDLVLDFKLLFNDTLHTPYVEGAQVRIWVDARRNLTGWSVESADPEVLAIQVATLDPEHPDGLSLSCVATGAGESELLLIDPRGEIRDRVLIDVRAPDRFELHAAAPMFVGLDDDETSPDAIVVLDGGLATFEVRWFEGDERLHGNGVLTATAPDALFVEAEQTYLFENREWIRFAPGEPGVHDVAIAANGAPLGVVPVEAIGEDAIAYVEIVGRDPYKARNGEHLVVMAQAFDAADRPIYGVDYRWTRDGQGEAGLGDLYRYTFDADAGAELTAARGEHAASGTVHGDGYVDSSNDIGCSSTGGPGPAWLGALGLLLVRRKR